CTRPASSTATRCTSWTKRTCSPARRGMPSSKSSRSRRRGSCSSSPRRSRSRSPRRRRRFSRGCSASTFGASARTRSWSVSRRGGAGADRGEFGGGAGEVLRAVLLVGVGGEPESLTEGLAHLVRAAAQRLPPADAVRLLALLADSEPQVRRSGNPRLVVELLLLRWAMMDRTVELAEVLEALKNVGQSDGLTVGQNPGASPVLRGVVP